VRSSILIGLNLVEHAREVVGLCRTEHAEAVVELQPELARVVVDESDRAQPEPRIAD
jgi:hypothetical protein